MAEIINIFNFLKEFNEISNPVITEIDNQKWNLNISDIPVIDKIRSVFFGQELGEMDYLEINRPTLLPCPNPEDSLIEWIKNDWKNLSVENAEIADKLPRKLFDENGDLLYKDEFFTDDQNRVENYNVWISERKIWREIEIPKSKGLELYNKLFRIYSEMKLESESVELMLGDGHIRWYTSDRVINHPVLLQKVQLNFDAHIPSFRIYCEEKKSDLYTPMLRVIPSINQKMLSDIIVEIDEGDFDIAQTENTEGLFKRIINVIDNKGEFIAHPRTINETATIHSAPVLFLRKRTLGFSSFIDGVIEDVQENSKIEMPDFFEIMSGNYTEDSQGEIVEKSWNHSGIDEEVLLTLPANNEQLRIIKYLDKYGAVLVQGPPGTGKTHTIANLIGHLLSQGNSVLVTSHTEKALSVLKEKVYKDSLDPELNLQNLCISVLSSTSQKKEMDEAINEIASKSSSVDLHSSLLKIERLRAERKELVNRSKNLTNELVRARTLEYKDLIYDNHSISPIDAAKYINSGKNLFDYINGKSNNDEIGFPLTQEELVFLYSSNEQLSIEEERLLMKPYPSSEQLLSSFEFASMVERINEIQNWLCKNIHLKEVELTITIDMVSQQLEDFKRLISMVRSFDILEEAIINKTIADPTYSKLWDDVLIKVEAIQIKYEGYRRLNLNYDFLIEESAVNKASIQTLQDIIDSGKEKPIGFFAKGEWKRLRDSIKINGEVIETREEFIKVYELISYEIGKQDVINLINKLLSDFLDLEDSAFDDFENKIRKYKGQIELALNWYCQECEPYIIKVDESIKWVTDNKLPRLSAIDGLDVVTVYLQSAYELYKAKLDEIELENLITQIDSYKKLLSEYADSNPVIEELLIAVNKLDKDSYTSNLKAFSSLINKNEILEKRSQLISKIRSLAPILANQIENREGIHFNNAIPEYFDDAWKHFQLRNQIERLDAIELEKIQSQIEQINTQLLKNAQILALEKAWYEKIKNQTDKQNQALNNWRTTIKRLGKEKGKDAPRLKSEARALMPLCQTAIPVWIMPLNRVVETFDPKNNKFDVIIIDEASQANILSIPALYLAKKVIIVGDDEQVSPEIFGIRIDELKALQELHLKDIPGKHLYSGNTSLYDMAKSSGFKPLMLTEHFRCLPEIIGFSNELSYSGRIKPLRDSSSTTVYPPVVEYRVNGAVRSSNKVNEVEVEHIVSLIQAFLEIDEYKGQTIGVISMLGNEQSAAIERKLQAVIDPILYEERKIQCGTPPQFQGDERDIIILSIVERPNENGGPLRLLSEDGNNDKYKKRYNVAVSRARNQLWVVHSLNPEIDLQPDDLRLKLIKYAINPNCDQENLLVMSESPFELEVMKYLLAQGYKIIPQFKVGAYRIDMVVQFKDKKVALECDGERFHAIENLDNDLARQAILERLGWRFIRIRGSAYYRNAEQTMKDVIESLESYGIFLSFEEVLDNPVNNSLIDAVKIKASTFRNKSDNTMVAYENEEIEQSVIVDVKQQTESESEVPRFEQLETEIVVDQPVIYKPIVDFQKKKLDEPINEFSKIDSSVITEPKTAKKGSGHVFDFRGKEQPATQQLKEIPKKVEVRDVESNGLCKPKFDFRNKK